MKWKISNKKQQKDKKKAVTRCSVTTKWQKTAKKTRREKSKQMHMTTNT